MVFKNYAVGPFRIQVRDLLRLRLKLKDDVRRHKKLIAMHKEKIDVIKSKELTSVEEKLNFYLDKVKSNP